MHWFNLENEFVDPIGCVGVRKSNFSSFHSLTFAIKVVHFSSVHSAYDIRIFHKECKILTAAGYKTVLIVAHDRNELIDNVAISAVCKPNNRISRLLITNWQIYKRVLKESCELCHFHDPELIPLGIILKLRKKRVIYDVHEDLPRQIKTKDWIPRCARGIVSWMAEIGEMFGALFFDGIVAATPSIARRFPPAKTALVQNFPILGELAVPDAISYGDRPLQIVYVGGITSIRGIAEMVKAVGLLPDNINASLVLAGEFSPAGLHDEVQRLPGWERVEFLGWQSRNSVAHVLAKSRVGLVTFHPAPNHINAQPNKLFEYMSAGIPVVASDFPLWRQIIEDAGCGLLVDPLNPMAIAEAIKWLLENPEEAEAMGKRGQEAVRKRYNWNVEGKKLLAFYEEILK